MGHKPGSVLLRVAIIPLGQQSLTGSSNLPASRAGRTYWRPIWSCSGWSLPCHKLLPVARCALTAPFHPYLCCKQPSAVYSLLHWSSARAAQTLSGTLPCGARTFLPFLAKAAIAWPTPARIVAKFATSRHGLFRRQIKIEDMQIVSLAHLNCLAGNKGNPITG